MYFAVWAGLGLGFNYASLDASPSIPGGAGRSLSFVWGNVSSLSYNASLPYSSPTSLVPPGVASAAYPQIVPGATVAGGMPLFVAPLNATTGPVVVFRPGAIGTYKLSAAVSDGCSTTNATVSVFAVCGATPIANATSLLSSRDGNVQIITWSANGGYRVSLPRSTIVRSSLPPFTAISRYFANVSLTAASTSAGSMGTLPRVVWTLLSHVPVEAPASNFSVTPEFLSWVAGVGALVWVLLYTLFPPTVHLICCNADWILRAALGFWAICRAGGIWPVAIGSVVSNPCNEPCLCWQPDHVLDAHAHSKQAGTLHNRTHRR